MSILTGLQRPFETASKALACPKSNIAERFLSKTVGVNEEKYSDIK
ncbi:MAG: hypothetical protein SWO11_00975 [Thermodesulfobacteriota bacterium]|nr:hypothetical protein [Thermodesulfobacteriota bacterium]